MLLNKPNHLSLSLSLSLYTYIYMCMCVLSNTVPRHFDLVLDEANLGKYLSGKYHIVFPVNWLTAYEVGCIKQLFDMRLSFVDNEISY